MGSLLIQPVVCVGEAYLRGRRFEWAVLWKPMPDRWGLGAHVKRGACVSSVVLSGLTRMHFWSWF